MTTRAQKPKPVTLLFLNLNPAVQVVDVLTAAASWLECWPGGKAPGGIEALRAVDPDRRAPGLVGARMPAPRHPAGAAVGEGVGGISGYFVWFL